ncbi:MAG: hypothetical protein QM766_03710 [Burkholderiaceae bacterium]
MSDNRVIHFIKPCRRPEEGLRTLTPDYATRLLTTGRVAQINLDNCSLQRMEQLPSEPTLQDAEAVGLLPLVQILQNAPVALCAIGVNEMPDCRVAGAKRAYERFCAAFWPGHQDDVDATDRTYDPSSTDRKIEFSELEDGARCTYGGAYVALLQMQNIHRTFPSLSPEAKFEAYLHGMIGMLGIVSAFELEIAKYAFWEPADVEVHRLPEGVRTRRKDIRENFTKLQGSASRCRHFAFNGAMDLHWLSGANFAQDLGVTIKAGNAELAIDGWVGTNDIKLYRISTDIHSVPFEGSTMKALVSAREPALTALPYWRNVDRTAKDALLYRRQAGHPEVDQLLPRIMGAVSHLEDQLRAVLPA